MEQQNNNTYTPRKMRFAPKAPPRRAPKLELKTYISFGTWIAVRVASSQVAFGYGRASTSIKLFGLPKGASRSSRETFNGGVHAPGLREEKEYKEPWDYYSYYPVTLPMRRPCSGNPGNITYDQNLIEPAVDLGLMLPPTVRMIKQTGSTAGHEVDSSSRPAAGVCSVKKTRGLEKLPAGLMGKMLVYKSGVVKSKLGNTIYDVSYPGLSCLFAQGVVAVNTAEKQCCVVWELNKRAVLTPDVDSVLNRLADL
ncbi:hypothetical protein CRYUN_Cryun26dG0045700 [Craigia yunnanensis]